MADVTVIHPIRKAHETGGVRTLDVVSALETAEEEKRFKYHALASRGGWDFSPLAVTTHGRWGKGALDFLECLRLEVKKRRGVDYARGIAHRWHQLLACALVKGNAVLLGRRAAKAAASEANSPSTGGLYRT
eukprot:Platyproteum_vivax@DN15687_c0_g1_i1.p1